MSCEEFMCGAQGAEPWCTQHFLDYIGDIDPHWDEGQKVGVRPNYFLSPSRNAMLLVHVAGNDHQIVGYYLPPGAVCVQEQHQGKGLGAELILATYEWCGGPPTQGLDEQCFTRSGYAAHLSAWRLGIRRGIFCDPAAKSTQTQQDPATPSP